MALGACAGCGAGLQTDNPGLPGFVPAKIAAEHPDSIVCRRCYRIEHYGKDDLPPPPPSSLRERLIARMLAADWAVLVVDLVDFEGSFDVGLAKAAGGRLFVAANKVDLLPPRTPRVEIKSWVEARLSAAGVRHQGVFLTSGARKEGLAALRRALQGATGGCGTAVLLGATNVGKSTLLSLWADAEAQPPTVSRFPGTTQGTVDREIVGTKLTIVDTPGLAPKDRLSDRLCPDCSTGLIPQKRLAGRLLALRPGQAVAWGGFAVLQLAPDQPGGGEVSLLFFSSEVTTPGRVRAQRERFDQVLDSGGWQDRPTVCERCTKRLLSGGTEEVRLEVGPYRDAAIHGLGWFSPRSKAANGAETTVHVRVLLPTGVKVSLRPRLVGPKPR